MLDESDIAGRKYQYRGTGRAAARMTLRADHRLDGAPSICEHAWEIIGDKLVLFHRDGRRMVEFAPTGNGTFAGVDLTCTPPGQAFLMERRRGFWHDVGRRFKRALKKSRRAENVPLTREAMLNQSIGIRIGKKTMRWVFQYGHDRDFLAKHILPWALPEHELISTETPADFVVGVYLEEPIVSGIFADLAGRKFLLSGEKESRFAKLDGCHAFVQNPLPADDPAYVRYCPTLCYWTPPRSTAKSAKCSVVDNGQYAWRAQMIYALASQIGGVDIFGKLSGKPLGGYHMAAGSGAVNEKYLGIERHCFYLALERAVAPDYITEKFMDPILCETVPIYDGAPNIDNYAVPGSYVPACEVHNIFWSDWRAEYEKRRPAVLAQKELLRSRLNLFSYFHRVTEDLALLDKPRPITRH